MASSRAQELSLITKREEVFGNLITLSVQILNGWRTNMDMTNNHNSHPHHLENKAADNHEWVMKCKEMLMRQSNQQPHNLIIKILLLHRKIGDKLACIVEREVMQVILVLG